MDGQHLCPMGSIKIKLLDFFPFMWGGGGGKSWILASRPVIFLLKSR